jgi:hypothetical protein
MRCFSIFLSLLLLLPFAVLAADVFVEEFENPDGWTSQNPPTGWQIYYDGQPHANDWHQSTYGPYAPDARCVKAPYQVPLIDGLYKTDIDCSFADNLQISFWYDIQWQGTGYNGYLHVYGSNDGFVTNHDIFWNYWPNSDTDIATVDISSWADNQPTVGIYFDLYINDSHGMHTVDVDSVHITGGYTVTQPASLGLVKALYQ